MQLECTRVETLAKHLETSVASVVSRVDSRRDRRMERKFTFKIAGGPSSTAKANEPQQQQQQQPKLDHAKGIPFASGSSFIKKKENAENVGKAVADSPTKKSEPPLPFAANYSNPSAKNNSSSSTLFKNHNVSAITHSADTNDSGKLAKKAGPATTTTTTNSNSKASRQTNINFFMKSATSKEAAPSTKKSAKDEIVLLGDDDTDYGFGTSSKCNKQALAAATATTTTTAGDKYEDELDNLFGADDDDEDWAFAKLNKSKSPTSTKKTTPSGKSINSIENDSPITSNKVNQPFVAVDTAAKNKPNATKKPFM